MLYVNAAEGRLGQEQGGGSVGSRRYSVVTGILSIERHGAYHDESLGERNYEEGIRSPARNSRTQPFRHIEKHAQYWQPSTKSGYLY